MTILHAGRNHNDGTVKLGGGGKGTRQSFFGVSSFVGLRLLAMPTTWFSITNPAITTAAAFQIISDSSTSVPSWLLLRTPRLPIPQTKPLEISTAKSITITTTTNNNNNKAHHNRPNTATEMPPSFSKRSTLLHQLFDSIPSNLVGIIKTPHPAGMVATQPHPMVLPLLESAAQPQSLKNRRTVEGWIGHVVQQAMDNPSRMQQQQGWIAPGSYRMVWSTVTANSLLGTWFHQRPCNVLGGPSWQVVSPDRSENVVYWKGWDLRMVGLARWYDLPASSPSLDENDDNDNSQSRPTTNYGVEICGLEFRWGGAGGCPEQYPPQPTVVPPPTTNLEGTPNTRSTKTQPPQPPQQQQQQQQKATSSQNRKSWQVLALDENTTLGNGVGELQVLYNDGVVRITRDVLRNNTYIHVREPLPPELQSLFPW
ncbi:hypothetical protein ACA910_001430 [Epithemia clementina (nom. ined.)]